MVKVVLALLCGLCFTGFPDAVFYGVVFWNVEDDGQTAVIVDGDWLACYKFGYLWGAGWDADESGHAEGFAGHFIEGVAPAFERAWFDT